MTFTSINELPLADDRTAGWSPLRDGAAVHFDGEQYVLASADAVEYATRHPEVFSSAKAFDRLGSPLPLIPIAVDPPEHARYRRMLDAFFAPRRLASLQDVLRAQAASLIDEIASRGSCEVMADLATPYPSQVFLTLFGLPLEDRERMLAWKDAILAFTDSSSTEPTAETVEYALELHGYLSGYVAARRGGAGDDLLTDLLNTRDEGGLTDDEIIGLCFLFVLAGLDTVTSALGFAFRFLATHPARQAELAADPSLVPDFVEEMLRLEVPVPFAPRVTTEDVEIDGVPIPAGSPIMLALGAANRDPGRHADPDDFLLDRVGRHFAFGGGPHRCLGSHLARLELKLVLEEWHRRIGSYALADGEESKVWWPAATLMLDQLPLVVTPAAVLAEGSERSS